VKKNSLYLYLALVCFVGIILIFVFDGYVGVYDSLKMDNGRFTQTVAYGQWAEDDYDYVRMSSMERGERMECTYTVENHRFSTYEADVTISFLHNDEEIAPPIAPAFIAAPFDEDEFTWIMEGDAFVPADYPDEQSYSVTVVISRGEVRREVNISISGLPAKIVPVPAR
jgi:hypothetical protein